jgi:hypothetical protein
LCHWHDTEGLHGDLPLSWREDTDTKPHSDRREAGISVDE